jgi:hypothetical protein
MSKVADGGVLTLVIPLSLLMVILGIWALNYRRALRRRRPPRAGAPPTRAESPPT